MDGVGVGVDMVGSGVAKGVAVVVSPGISLGAGFCEGVVDVVTGGVGSTGVGGVTTGGVSVEGEDIGVALEIGAVGVVGSGIEEVGVLAGSATGDIAGGVVFAGGGVTRLVGPAEVDISGLGAFIGGGVIRLAGSVVVMGAVFIGSDGEVIEFGGFVPLGIVAVIGSVEVMGAALIGSEEGGIVGDVVGWGAGVDGLKFMTLLYKSCNLGSRGAPVGPVAGGVLGVVGFWAFGSIYL